MEMYSDLEIGSIVHVNGNTDLLPEKINTTEASLSHAFNKDMQLSLNVFHIYASDIMYMNKVSQILPSGLLRADIGYVNEQSMEINGGEMAFAYRIDPALKTTLNYSYQDTKDLALERELQLAPAHKFGMRWDIRLGTAVRCTTYTYYVSRKTEFWSDTVAVYTEPYTVTNGRIAYELGPQAELSLAVDNLSNARYEEIPTHTFGGRTVMLDFACRF
jgi:outer membrane receptor protein involved in Fe transport